MKTAGWLLLVGGGLAFFGAAGFVIYMSTRKKPEKPRDMLSVDALMIHQARCDFNPGPHMIAAFHGDYDAAKHARAMLASAHVVALKCGHYVTPHSIDMTIAHVGPGLRRSRSIGIEIEGSYQGVDIPQPYELTDALMEAARAGLQFATRTATMMHASLKYILAHRQVSAERPGDPGPEIWKRLVLDFAVPSLGLVTIPAYHAQGGKPIPKEWDVINGVGTYA